MNVSLIWLLLGSTASLLPTTLSTVQESTVLDDWSRRNGLEHDPDKRMHDTQIIRPSSSNRRETMTKTRGEGGAVEQLASLGKILKELTRERARPTTDQWGLFRRMCRSSRRQAECKLIFTYFRRVLLPLAFPGQANHERHWAEGGIIGLAKYTDVSHTRAYTSLETVHQFGDDSSVLGGDYLVVSDGVTRNPVSDFFSRQVVEFLSAGMQRLERQRRRADPADQIFELVSVLEDLIVEVQLPAAATLSLVHLSNDRRYLYVGTLGDSEVKVIRRGKVIYGSPLQRTRNMPGQLNAHRRAVAEHMSVDRVRLYEGDWIVVASDGLWDNVFEGEVAALLRDNVQNSLTRIMNKALGRKDNRRPVCKYDERLKRERCAGGREDDITIALARV